MRARLLAFLLAFGAATGAVVAACDTPPTATRCTNIPEGGCPRQYGVSCEDLSCAAIYLCRAGNVWELERTCPARDGAAGDASGGDAGEGGSSRDVDTDVEGAWGGPGCAPLQPPDCMLGTAVACGGQAGCCGCDDLYVCRDGGWDLWGFCGPGGPTPQ
jgi:hypothetical protein